MKKVESSNIKVSKEVELTEKKDLKEEFALWENTSSKGTVYFTGYCGDIRLIAFENKNKKNEKEPDIRIYQVYNNELSKETVCSLWKNVSKSGKYYLSGKDNEGKKLIGFFNDKMIEYPDRPIIRVYSEE